MKFLKKNKQSKILVQKIEYKKDSTKNNQTLLKELVHEQKGFCAYTEKYIQKVDAVEVEHFNPSIKYSDDYFNYYAVLREANLRKRKKEEDYKNAKFFQSLFFQNEENFNKRIRYVSGEYEPVNEDDEEATQLIDFLGLNDYNLFITRQNHINRLKNNKQDAHYDLEKFKTYLANNKDAGELSFITAIEHEFDTNLTYLL